MSLEYMWVHKDDGKWAHVPDFLHCQSGLSQCDLSDMALNRVARRALELLEVIVAELDFSSFTFAELVEWLSADGKLTSSCMPFHLSFLEGEGRIERNSDDSWCVIRFPD